MRVYNDRTRPRDIEGVFVRAMVFVLNIASTISSHNNVGESGSRAYEHLNRAILNLVTSLFKISPNLKTDVITRENMQN